MSPSATLSFSELVKAMKKLPFDEIRKEQEGYFEIVVVVTDLPLVYPLLEGFYGSQFKPPGVAASSKAKKVAQNYGGIQTQQTLYYVNRNDVSDCAMIWPWNDNKHATIKMARGRAGE